MRAVFPWCAAVLLVLSAACARPPGAGSSPAELRAALAGGEWELLELNGAPAPMGAGRRPATIRFESDSARVTGFAGCNRYFGSYTLDGAALRFGAIGMTRMACAEGMSLEQQLSAALEATRRYEVAERELKLASETGTIARFIRASP